MAPLGENVNEFEKEVASYIGIGHAAALSSGTAALHLAYILAGITEGDTVLCQDLTFSATANPLAYQHANVVFVDSERETWNMDPKALGEGIFSISGSQGSGRRQPVWRSGKAGRDQRDL